MKSKGTLAPYPPPGGVSGPGSWETCPSRLLLLRHYASCPPYPLCTRVHTAPCTYMGVTLGGPIATAVSRKPPHCSSFLLRPQHQASPAVYPGRSQCLKGREHVCTEDRTSAPRGLGEKGGAASAYSPCGTRGSGPLPPAGLRPQGGPLAWALPSIPCGRQNTTVAAAKPRAGWTQAGPPASLPLSSGLCNGKTLSPCSLLRVLTHQASRLVEDRPAPMLAFPMTPFRIHHVPSLGPSINNTPSSQGLPAKQGRQVLGI